MRKVLLIVFDFPPRRTSGVYRPVRFTKHLVGRDWLPTVVTIQGRKGEAEDPTLLEKVPAVVRIVKTPYFRVAGWENRAVSVVRTAGAMQSPAREVRQPFMDRMLRRLAAFLRSSLYFPDDSLGWIPFGFAKAVKLLFEEPYDVVYSTSPPRAGLVIGLLLKLFLRVRWVAEFRDPWYLSPRPLRRRFERWLEGSIVRHADAVVVVTHGHAEYLQNLYHPPEGKLAVVTNGFDEEDFAPNRIPVRTTLAPSRFHFSHFGTVYENFSGGFFPALIELLRESPTLKERIRVNIIGIPDDAILQYAREEELQGVLEIRPLLPHADAIAAMYASQCLLLFLGHPEYSRLAVSGKLYEYLRAGRHILAMTYEGGAKTIIESAKAGWALHPQDTEGIKRALREVLESNGNSLLTGPGRAEHVAQFRYDRLTAQLVKVLDRVSRDI